MFLRKSRVLEQKQGAKKPRFQFETPCKGAASVVPFKTEVMQSSYVRSLQAYEGRFFSGRHRVRSFWRVPVIFGRIGQCAHESLLEKIRCELKTPQGFSLGRGCGFLFQCFDYLIFF